MKKLLLILLLTILPIQYSWSMAAVYCQHEESKVTHFGHHGHQHQDQNGDADKSKLSKHGDCEICHHAVQASAPPAGTMPALLPLAVFAPPGALHYHSFIADGPPRPDWQRHA